MNAEAGPIAVLQFPRDKASDHRQSCPACDFYERRIHAGIAHAADGAIKLLMVTGPMCDRPGKAFLKTEETERSGRVVLENLEQSMESRFHQGLAGRKSDGGHPECNTIPGCIMSQIQTDELEGRKISFSAA